MGILDTIIGGALLLLVLRVAVRAFQEFRAKGSDPARKGRVFSLAVLVVAAYVWLMYFDGVVRKMVGA